MASTEKLKTRAVIKFSQQQGDNSPKTLKENAAAHGKHAVSRTVYFDWHTFVHVLEKEPQALTTSKEEGERRKKKVTPTLMTFVANALENDKLLTVKLLETKFDVSYGNMQTIFMRV